MLASIMQKPIIAPRDVGILCPLHKLPLTGGIEPESKEFVYCCDFCDGWATAELIVAVVSLRERRDRVIKCRQRGL